MVHGDHCSGTDTTCLNGFHGSLAVVGVCRVWQVIVVRRACAEPEAEYRADKHSSNITFYTSDII
jgi:hypothetical protein